jgi:hypothetical protein
MSPRELQGLQALAKAHGGSLTINPQTGLAEAGFLEQVLPIVAAAAATYFTAGAAAPAIAGALGSAGMGAAAAGTAGGILAGAGSGALISGGMAAAQGKDAGKAALMGGLGGAVAGGMGAYGDATTFAADAAQKSAMEGAVQGGGFQQVGGDQLIPTEQGNLFLPGGSAQSSVNIGPNVPEQFAQSTGSNFAPAASSAASSAAPSAAPSATPPPVPAPKPSYYTNLAPDSYVQKAGIQALPAAGLFQDGEPALTTPEEKSKLKSISPNFYAQSPVQPNPYYRAQYPSYASGGLTALAPGGSIEEKKKKQRASLTSDRNMAAMSADQAGLAMLNNARYGANMTSASPARSSMALGDLPNPIGAAGGGLTSLGGYSDGGRLLKGPGDGMSDSIPAKIGTRQPARLADGEFVIPADVVSHLGNGSTDAGAKRLYAMMAKVRSARTGKKKQAPAVNTGKFLPA